MNLTSIINDEDNDGETMLRIACKNGNLEIAKLLLSVRGVDVNFDVPLVETCRNGHIEVVKLLLAQKGIDVNECDARDYTPLTAACRKGHIEIVKLLFTVDGIKPNNKEVGTRPLEAACRAGNVELVKFLLGYIDDINSEGDSPLQYACEEGHLEVVKLLLNQKGIDVNSSYLSVACSHGHLEIVKLLLTRGDIEFETSELLKNACKGGNIDIVKLALDFNSDVNSTNSLYYACLSGNFEVVKLLMSFPDININLVNNNRDTPLSAACSKDHIEIVKLLLNTKGIEINKCRALYCACASGNIEIVKLLLGEGADIGESERNLFNRYMKEKLGVEIDVLKEKMLSETLHLRTMRSRIQELEQINSEQKDTIKNLLEKNDGLKHQLSNSTPSITLTSTRSNNLNSLKRELMRIDNQIKDIVNGTVDGWNELNNLIEKRNKLGLEIVENYSEKLTGFEQEKLILSDLIERLETDIREYRNSRDTFENANKLKLKKKELLQDLSSIKKEIEDTEFENDDLSFEIRKQKRNNSVTPQELSGLEKKLASISEKLTNLNDSKSKIHQKLMDFIPDFPEIIFEMDQSLSKETSIASQSQNMSPEDKFRIFALQNSILLSSASLSNYENKTILHTGLSVVYRAIKGNNQVVILKEIPLSDSNCDAVMNEIMNTLRLKAHSRIIKLNGVFVEPEFKKVYIESPYYSKGNLLDYITTICNQYDLPTLKIMLRALFRKITETLQFIHSKDILHRDLKPQNILVNENGEPVIADFGSSKKLIVQLTNKTIGVGTMKYMSPEVKRQGSPTEKSDIWSLGVSLYECWKVIHNKESNELANSVAEILDFGLNGKVVLPTNLELEIDVLLMKMLTQIFETNPRSRPSTLMLLTDEEYFTQENPSIDLLSRSNQELDASEKLTLWQARLKKVKHLTLLSSPQRNEIKFKIHRSNLLEDISIKVATIMNGNNKKSMFFTTFVKYIGENGIDQGGLSNELFSKYVETMLLESKQFERSETSSIENYILTNEPLTEQSTEYLKTFGWLLKKLLIDCDDKTVFLPLNSFIFYYLLNGDIFKKQTLPLNQINLTLTKFLREYDFELVYQIMNLVKCRNDDELQAIMCEETFQDVLSKTEKPLIMENVQLFICSRLYSYFYTKEKLEKLELIKSGFEWFNLKEFKAQSSNTRNNELKEFLAFQGSDFDEEHLSVIDLKILLSGQSYIDADLLLNEMDFSALSTLYLKDFLIRCIRKLTKSQLRQLLVWLTALSSIPMRGFSTKIKVHEYTRFEAHTCSFSFDIPQISDFDEFEKLFLNCLRLSSDSTMEDN